MHHSLKIVAATPRHFTPLSLFAKGEAGGWWDPSDLTTLFQNLNGTTAVTADGDPVGYIADKSGRGNHLIAAANDTTRPTFKTSGGLSWIEFDGSNDTVGVSFSISQPWERISAIRQISWTSNERIFSGVAANSGMLYQFSASPNLAVFSGGSNLSTNPDPAVGADAIMTEQHSGATSRVATNNAAYVSVNAGTTATDGLRVGANSGALSSWSNFRLYGLIMRAGTMTDEQIGDMRRYLQRKAGVAF